MERRPVIMMVEGDKEQQWLYRRWLEDGGFYVIQAEDGAWALSRLVSDSPDLVLLDLGLPAASGFEVCRNIKSSGSEDLPVVVMMSKREEHLKLLAKQAGADVVLVKPFSRVELIAYINKVLNIQQDWEEDEKIRELEDRVSRRLVSE